MSPVPITPARSPEGQLYAGRYEIRGILGQGGMGQVLRAFDRQLQREVAIKVALDTPQARERLEREMVLTAQLQHPGIVALYERGTRPDGTPFLVMRQVPGRPLDALLKEATDLRSRLAFVPTVVTVAEALAYSHQQ